MKKIKETQFSDVQLNVIHNTLPLDTLCSSLLEISANVDYSLNQKRFLMFREIVSYMRERKSDFLLVNIKSNIADKLISNELETLEIVSKELKNVIL